MMNGLLVAGLILGIGAPAPKEAPTKAQPSIVGMWESKMIIIVGEEEPIGPFLFEFMADGQFNMTKVRGDDKTRHKHKLDTSKDPPEVDFLMESDVKKTLKGIYKIDGDTLTVCLGDRFSSSRPTKFESVKGSETQMWILRRVENKK